MGAAELITYPYWCLEKGYGKFTGKNDGSKAWQERAAGWMRLTGRLSLALVGVLDNTVASAVEVDQRKLLGLKEIAPEPVQAEERKCYTNIRRGAETVQTEIPCTN